MGDMTVGSILFVIFYAAMMSFSISIIIFVLLYANIYVDKTKIERLRKTNENRYYNYMLKRKLADRAIYAAIIIGVLIIFFSLALKINVNVIDEKTNASTDIENWASLVIELGLGAYIALAILTYDNFQNEKIKKRRKQRQEYGLQKIKLLTTLAKEEFQDKDYESAKETFDSIARTLTIFSDAFEQSETQQILELSEIGKIFCKYRGEYPTYSNRTMPFTTSIPANTAALIGKFEEVLLIISENITKSD